MPTTTDEVRRPPPVIDLARIRFTPEELDAVQRGLTIALTKRHWERRGARSEGR